jgi:putative ABC transport system permease protein
MVMQSANLFPGTVAANVAFGIPGVMAGMMVSGASPVYAGLYQFTNVAIILAASGITGMVNLLLICRRTFSSAAQLILRSG